MYIYLILALQCFCIYHCYTNRNTYYWIFAIIFLPVIGSLIYLFADVFQRKDVDSGQEETISVINPTKKITNLVKKCEFSDTFKNRTQLGDAYLEAKMYDKAIENYKISLSGTFQNDFYVTAKLLEAHYFSSQFTKVLELATKLIPTSKFKKSKASFLYALTLEKEGSVNEAETYLSLFDAPFRNYQERLELANFYIRNAKLKKARTLLNEIMEESESMSKTSLRNNKVLIKRAKELLETQV